MHGDESSDVLRGDEPLALKTSSARIRVRARRRRLADGDQASHAPGAGGASPRPEVNHTIRDRHGCVLRRFDLCYPDVQVIVGDRRAPARRQPGAVGVGHRSPRGVRRRGVASHRRHEQGHLQATRADDMRVTRVSGTRRNTASVRFGMTGARTSRSASYTPVRLARVSQLHKCWRKTSKCASLTFQANICGVRRLRDQTAPQGRNSAESPNSCQR